MKKNIIVKGLAGVLVAASMSSCAGDYLDLKPVTSVTAGTVEESVAAFKAAVVGAVHQVSRQYGDYSLNGTNGEAWMVNCYGDSGLGADMNTHVWTYLTWASSNRPTAWRQENTWLANLMWRYAYSIITGANYALDAADKVPTESQEEVNEMKYLRAVALSMRAHAYIRLLQVYAPRWVDSNNGAQKCIILRTSATQEPDQPFSSMGEVLNLIYTDLDTAISLFNESGLSNSDVFKDIMCPDINVARGFYARAALLKNDYKTAQKMAHDSRQGFPIMSAEEYIDGFIYANDEYMWTEPFDESNLYYWTFASYHGVGGYYNGAWDWVDVMDYQLYKKISSNDCRKLLYMAPEIMAMHPEINSKAGVDVKPMDMFTNMKVNSYLPYFTSGDLGSSLRKWWFYYLNNYIKPASYTDGWGPYSNNNNMTFGIGTQMKFWGVGPYAAMQFPFMRAAEQLLNEAEAACMNDDEATAKACLMELMAKRDPSYTCNLSGNALLEEVKLQRRIELWGEGFSFFDLKRWNVPRVRNVGTTNPATCGNWFTGYDATMQPDELAGWVTIVPQTEFMYNKLANRADLPH